jgi:hypothetical protein
MVNSLRISFLTRKDDNSDSASATIVKPSHQSGNRHQSGYSCGEKPDMRLPTTSKGKAMSMANDCKKASVSDGTRLLPIIQKPSSPMPRSTSTACKVVRKTFILFPSRMWESASTAFHYGPYGLLLPPWRFETKGAYAAIDTQIVAFRWSNL